MEPWQQLVATALMGTGRQAPAPPPGEGALVATLNQLDWQQPEAAVLGAAAAIALHQQVGRQPLQQDWPPVAPSPPDRAPPIQATTARHLSLALANDRELLPELLALIAAAGQRVSEQWLPKLLTRGQQDVELRSAITAVIGQRGQWLAAQNPNWSYGQVGDLQCFAPDSPESQALWQTGRRGERVLFLRQWRAIAPEAAREALAAVWATAAAKEREAFINVLATGLSRADEPFLAAALGDRAQGVRQAAAALLSRLPTSRLGQRMAARLQPLVQRHGTGKQLKINVTLPQTYESDWERDGIQARAGNGKAERGWWLEQMLAAAPLDLWGEPAPVVGAIAGHTWQNLLASGWGQAAHRQQRADWAEALLAHLDFQAVDEFVADNLLALLAPPQAQQHLQAQLPSQSDKEALIRWLHLVSRRSQAWDFAFSQLVLEQFKVAIAASNRKIYSLAGTLKLLGLTLHPDLAPAVAALAAALPSPDTSPYFAGLLSDLANRLNFRREFQQAFRAGE